MRKSKPIELLNTLNRTHDTPVWNLSALTSKKLGILYALIKRGYRALGYIAGDEIIEWYWIGPHDEYIQRIRA